MRQLVTGGAGFIGSHLVDTLLRRPSGASSGLRVMQTVAYLRG
jgi:nucleoside-diphosphate-sugar epimerase